MFPRGGTPPIERSSEVALGDLVADTLRTKYGTQLVFINGGGFRDTVPAAGYTPANTTLQRPGTTATGPFDVTLGDAMSSLPFPNNVATTYITGANLWKALENGVSGYPTQGRFPQISGFAFSFDPTRPEGSRVTSVTLPDGTPIPADDHEFSVTTLDYMIPGGDGYVGVFDHLRATIRDPYVDALVDGIRADHNAGKITSVNRIDGRISRSN